MFGANLVRKMRESYMIHIALHCMRNVKWRLWCVCVCVCVCVDTLIFVVTIKIAITGMSINKNELHTENVSE